MQKGAIGLQVLITAVLGIILLVVANSVGSEITTKINENQVEFNTLSVVNETLTNASSMTLAQYNAIQSTLIVWNGTAADGVSFPTANFTFSCIGTAPNSICSINISSSSYTGFSEASDFAATYDYAGYYQTHAYNISAAGTVAIGDVSDWYGTIVVVIIASFILVLLVGQFVKIGSR